MPIAANPAVAGPHGADWTGWGSAAADPKEEEDLPLSVLLDVSAALALGSRFSRDADRSELVLLTPFSLAGAVLATLSRRHLETAVRVARDAVRVDMATDESFQDVFVDKLRLAH